MIQTLEVAVCERKCLRDQTTAKEQIICSDIVVLTEFIHPTAIVPIKLSL